MKVYQLKIDGMSLYEIAGLGSEKKLIDRICIYKYKFKGKSLINGLLYIPVVIPEIVLGISLLTIFSKVNISIMHY